MKEVTSILIAFKTSEPSLMENALLEPTVELINDLSIYSYSF
jgi:hypothetical protein